MIFEFLLGVRQAGIIDDQQRLAAQNRELTKRIEQLERQIAALTPPAPVNTKEPNP